MLTIRPEQLAAFDAAAKRSFAAFLLPQLRANPIYGVDAAPPDEILRTALAAIDRATAYGIETKQAIGCFVFLSFAVGHGFDAHPAVTAILTDWRIPPDRRPFELSRRLPAQVWRECSSIAVSASGQSGVRHG